VLLVEEALGFDVVIREQDNDGNIRPGMEC
jgi:hypothetical protein